MSPGSLAVAGLCDVCVSGTEGAMLSGVCVDRDTVGQSASHTLYHVGAFWFCASRVTIFVFSRRRVAVGRSGASG